MPLQIPITTKQRSSEKLNIDKLLFFLLFSVFFIYDYIVMYVVVVGGSVLFSLKKNAALRTTTLVQQTV